MCVLVWAIRERACFSRRVGGSVVVDVIDRYGSKMSKDVVSLGGTNTGLKTVLVQF